jgi:predicted HTH domain antitoxin
METSISINPAYEEIINFLAAGITTLLRYGDISSGLAARLLGISRLEVIDLMAVYGISVFSPQSKEELEQEVAETLAMLEK